jgi:Tfp pilus assembly protein PilN
VINLLPPQEKNELEMERKIKITTILGSLILIFLIFLGTLFFSVKIYLLSQIQNQKVSLDLENQAISTPEVQELEKNITEANKRIFQLNSFYKGEINISQILEKISSVLPTETYLINFSYQAEKSQVILQGYAKNRENLLEFKKSLENLKEVQNLYSPISNLTKPTDIDFYFSFNLIKE